jgi:hypothetical protein
MTAIDNTPSNKNFLNPLNFAFRIKRAPHVNFFTQELNIPGISLVNTIQPNPFTNVPRPGDHMNYENFSLKFKVDEAFENYFEIHNWIRALGKPDNYGEYANIASKSEYSGEGVYSDLSVIVLNAVKLPIFEVEFINAFPVALSELNFTSTDESVEYISASATFKYTLFNIKKIY